MRSCEFETWAHLKGGLSRESAISYVSYLRSVEQNYGADLDSDWKVSHLRLTRTRLENDPSLNENTRRNRLSALTKYENFCSTESTR